MDRSARTASIARWLLLSAAAVCAFGMLGPFRGLEKHIVPVDKAAHFIAFYGLTLLSFSAFPNRRRMDLVTLAIFVGAGVEVLQSLTGRDGELGDLLADAAGALAVVAPIWLERQREVRVERRAARFAAATAPAQAREPETA